MNKNLLLAQPFKLKYDDKTHHLFINDLARQKIIEINDSNTIVQIYGSKGKGPSELLLIENFFITLRYLFIVDSKQKLIKKYNRRDGQYISSLDYGKYLLKKKRTLTNGLPSAPPNPWADNNNKPFVTQKGTVLLPTQTGGKYLYEEISWNGKKLADMGVVPKGYAVTKSKNKYWSTLEDNEIPPQNLVEAFPVNDCSDSSNIYLVYSAIPKIAKYNLSGRKIWEHKIPRMPEVDSILTTLSFRAKRVENHPENNAALIPRRTYVAGRCSPDGDIFLTTYTHPAMPKEYRQPMYIHQFSPEGKLIKRYKIVSDENVVFYPAIDFEQHRIFVSLFRNVSIEIYHF